MTDKEKAIVMAYTGYATLKGEKSGIYYDYLEKLFGRPVFTHEFTVFADEIQEKSKPDFIAMCADETAIDPESDDFGCILCAAVRYTLGRRTYMTSLVPNFIRPLLPHLSNKTVLNLRKDVSECKNYGDDCDAQNWKNFLSDVETEIKKRAIA